MLKIAIKRFSDNLAALREFVDVTQPFLESRKEDVLKGRARDLAPIILAMDSISDGELRLTDDQRASIRNNFDGEIHIENNPASDTSKGVSLNVEGPGQRSFHEAMKRLHITEHHSHLLRANSLIALVSAGEWFLSEILHSHFSDHPESAGIREKALSLQELMTIGSVQEAQRYLIDTKVEEILRGDFDSWVSFLKEKLNLSMGYAKDHTNEMVEICQRRHLLVHNGGHINQIYLKKVDQQLWCSSQIDDEVPIDKAYLDSAIDTFERVLTLVAFELWKKTVPEDKDRGTLLINIAFDRLKDEKWTVAEGLSYFLMRDKGLPERDQIIGQLNYWQAVKWQDRFAEVEECVRAADYSAKEELYRLAQSALLEDEKAFFEMLPRVLETENFGLEDLHTWPIFRAIRETDTYLSEYGENSAEMSGKAAPTHDQPSETKH